MDNPGYPYSDGALAIETRKLNLYYGTFQALYDIDLDPPEVCGRCWTIFCVILSGCGFFLI